MGACLSELLGCPALTHASSPAPKPARPIASLPRLGAQTSFLDLSRELRNEIYDLIIACSAKGTGRPPRNEFIDGPELATFDFLGALRDAHRRSYEELTLRLPSASSTPLRVVVDIYAMPIFSSKYPV